MLLAYTKVNGLEEKGRNEMYVSSLSILVICQEFFEKDFDVFFRKKGNFNRPLVGILENLTLVRYNI